jgi:hypothetical protein
MSPTTTHSDLATRNRDICHQPELTLIYLLETWIYVTKHNSDLATRNRDMCHQTQL